MISTAGSRVPRDEYYDVDVDVSELKHGDVVFLGKRLAIVEQVSPFMSAYDVVFRRPGSLNRSCFAVRGSVRLIQRTRYYGKERG